MPPSSSAASVIRAKTEDKLYHILCHYFVMAPYHLQGKVQGQEWSNIGHCQGLAQIPLTLFWFLSTYPSYQLLKALLLRTTA